ncbi:MAG: PHP domain-containing protein, partial [Chloroflexota bacterium]
MRDDTLPPASAPTSANDRGAPYAGFQCLKGETHLHTLHSDGRDGVAEMFRACHRAGYDFAVLTDHNTLSGSPEALAAGTALPAGALVGTELTTFRGHAVCTGVACMPEWRDLEQRGVDAFARE